MITHFQWKPLLKQSNLPGWRISFFFNGVHYDAIYHRSGQIEWGQTIPPKDKEQLIIEQIHELMLFHIYD
ncbi:YheE family protein [Bacillus kexueae]|uniref:YheE family protein n=1 Tax=Aeribacillus kexueae TaxID=2078952 RepID=UPI001FAEEACF|nr:YheE family protein [Bacillus kexueae]